MSLKAMMEAAGQFPQHLQAGLSAVEHLDLPGEDFDHVLVVGMGGSAIGGQLALSLLGPEADVPLVLNRDHTVPGFVDDKTLVVATSYSGATAETLDAVQAALDRGASLVAITTGGRLGHLAETQGAPFVTVPSGFQPRAAVGWLFGANYGILARLLDAGDPAALARAGKELEPEVARLADPDGPAAYIARQLDDGTVGVVGHDVLGVVAERWAGELNENGKRLAFHSVMPEMCHNQIVGWHGQAGNATLLLLRRANEDNTEAARMSYLAENAQNSDGPVVEVELDGDRLDQVAEGILVGDFVSLHVARLAGIDPEPVETIQGLKRRLRAWR